MTVCESMAHKKRLILASASAMRQNMLKKIGFEFEIIEPDCDEEYLKKIALHEGMNAGQTACFLAQEKALIISRQNPDAFVIGSDQILSFEGKIFSKAYTMKEAEENLLKMAAKSHYLISAAALAYKGEILWQDTDQAQLFMRPLTRALLQIYFEKTGPEILGSVGSYHYEGFGFHLFERVEGAYFTILGLPLEKLVTALRDYASIGFQDGLVF